MLTKSVKLREKAGTMDSFLLLGFPVNLTE